MRVPRVNVSCVVITEQTEQLGFSYYIKSIVVVRCDRSKKESSKLLLQSRCLIG